MTQPCKLLAPPMKNTSKRKRAPTRQPVRLSPKSTNSLLPLSAITRSSTPTTNAKSTSAKMRPRTLSSSRSSWLSERRNWMRPTTSPGGYSTPPAWVSSPTSASTLITSAFPSRIFGDGWKKPRGAADRSRRRTSSPNRAARCPGRVGSRTFPLHRTFSPTAFRPAGRMPARATSPSN